MNSCLQPGKIWWGECKNMVGRKQRENTSSIPLKCIPKKKWNPKFCLQENVTVWLQIKEWSQSYTENWTSHHRLWSLVLVQIRDLVLWWLHFFQVSVAIGLGGLIFITNQIYIFYPPNFPALLSFHFKGYFFSHHDCCSINLSPFVYFLSPKWNCVVVVYQRN